VEVTQVSLRIWLSASVLAASVAAGLPGVAGAADQKQPAVYTFGTLKTPTVEAARGQAQTWLDGAGKTDDASKAAFKAIWDSDKPLIDRVSETLTLGDADAAKLLAEARDPGAPPPKEVPGLLRDSKRPVYYRSNLALAYAKALSGKRVYEEALDALKAAVPEQVVDPAAYYFHKAVAEHALTQKKDATFSITRLLDDVADAPERYKMVATLMFVDMQGWKDEEKDLGNIARLMDNSERRLDLSRGGPKTQEIQKKIVFRLDELIKDIENQMKNGGQSQCPGGQTPGNGGNQGPTPMQDSQIATNSGPGLVDPKKLQNLAANWGKLPEKERAKAMMELTKDLPPRYREVIENYFKTLARSQGP
jgi:tetratricopeptide (TPR) repeat protein